MSKTSSKRCKSSSLVVLMLFLPPSVRVYFFIFNSGYKRLMDGLSYHQKAFPNLVNNYELIISFSLVPIETYFVPRILDSVFILALYIFFIDYMKFLNTQTPKPSLHHDIGVHVCDLWKLFMAFFCLILLLWPDILSVFIGRY